MIADYSRDLLRSGIIELKAGNRDTARRYIDRALYMSGDHDVMAEGWYWMSQLIDDPVEKRKALENCLSNDMQHARARRALAILDGKLNPDEIINPDDPASAPEAETDSQVADAQRFMCPKCGGRMHFAPDGQSLVCEYCTRHQALGGSPVNGGNQPEQKDFLLAMATARGHGKPLAEQVFHCQGCGAQFILSPEQLSITCPYCGSPHVVSFEKSPDLLAPDGIIPHAFDAAHAESLLTEWLAKTVAPPLRLARPVQPPRAFYLPLWSFEIGGTVDYTGEMVEEQDMGFGRHQPRLVRVSDTYPVMLSRLPIPASRKLSAPFVHLLPTFDLKTAHTYDPRYLADWPAELYDIPMADASLDARSQGFSIARREMQMRLGSLRLISASSANLTIESFALDLLPIWMTEISVSSSEAGSNGQAKRSAARSTGEEALVPHLLLINGQTGNIYADITSKPSHSGHLLPWLSDLIAP
jgi:DNA-directed RNA polymerase subunit RPC12/RpoP